MPLEKELSTKVDKILAAGHLVLWFVKSCVMGAGTGSTYGLASNAMPAQLNLTQVSRRSAPSFDETSVRQSIRYTLQVAGRRCKLDVSSSRPKRSPSCDHNKTGDS